MKIEELIVNDKFKKFNDILELVYNEDSYKELEISYGDQSLRYYPILINTIARSAREYSVSGDKNADIVYGIYMRTIAENLRVGLVYVTPDKVTEVFSPVHSQVEFLSNKIFFAMDIDRQEYFKLDNTNSYLDFSNYDSYEIVAIGQYKFFAYTPEKVEESKFIMVAIEEENSNEEQDNVFSEIFALRDEDEIDEFFDEMDEYVFNDIKIDKDTLLIIKEYRDTLKSLIRE